MRGGTQYVARMPRNIVQVRKSVKTLLDCSMEKKLKKTTRLVHRVWGGGVIGRFLERQLLDAMA
jgi:hypothetical protein